MSFELHGSSVSPAAPYFIYDLHDQHVDVGRRLTWRCEARGQPAPTYAWLKVSHAPSTPKRTHSK